MPADHVCKRRHPAGESRRIGKRSNFAGTALHQENPAELHSVRTVEAAERFSGNPDAPGRRRLNKPASPALRKQKAVVSQHLPILRQPGDRGAFADSGGTAKEHPPSLVHRQRTVAEQKFPREEFRKQSEKEEHPRRPAEPHRRIRLSGQETADQTGLRVDRRIQVAAAAVYPPGRNRQTGKKFTAGRLRHRSAAFRQTGCGTEKFEQPAGGGPFRTPAAAAAAAERQLKPRLRRDRRNGTHGCPMFQFRPPFPGRI